MDDLREKVAAIIERECVVDAYNHPEDGPVGEIMNANGAADAILALPEIAEALATHDPSSLVEQPAKP